ncbi:NACHT domain-containing protein [Actinopolymorpha singaporensis]|uniref:NACHT domain-containing protein n=1 Tax=Actinopolymorpha singaporensis TaxID=117157 RepID=UPI0012FDE544|nr:NACHT domain-containing protein [Actinopolymorpha singaporensis]
MNQFVSSPELENLALSIASILLLDPAAKASGERFRDLREGFRWTCRLTFIGRPDEINRLGEALFDRVYEAVTRSIAVGQAVSTPHASIAAQAAVMKAASSAAAASVRNTKLLSRIEKLDEILSFEKSLRTQIASLHNGIRVPHTDTTKKVSYSKLFVQPTLRRIEEDEAENERDVNVNVLLLSTLRLIILGDPGGGKSTTSLKLTYDVASGRRSPLSATVPFLVVLRDYAKEYSKSRMPLIEYLAQLCRTPYSVEPPEDAIEYLLLNGRALVVFDGLDELLDVADRRQIVEIVEGFCYRYPTTPVLVTSRRVGYEEAPLDKDLFTVAQLQEFDDDQVETYARKWFSLDGSIPKPHREERATSFLRESELVKDLRVNPLMLSLMCSIYASENYIPTNRPEVYEKCALVLFDRWDRHRGIVAPLSFDAHVQSAMRALALWLYSKQEKQGGIPRKEIISFMKEYLLKKRFDNEEDAENAATEFVDFCKGRAWVLTDVGADLYWFTHRTFLEYFAASQLVRQHPSARDLFAELQDTIFRTQSDVVCQLAVQILGRTVEDGADDFLELAVDASHSASEEHRVSALSFASRSLRFVVPRSGVVRKIVEASFDIYVTSRPALGTSRVFRGIANSESIPVRNLLGASRENIPLISKYLQERADARLSTALDERCLALMLLTPSFYDDFGYWTEWAVDNWERMDSVIQRAQVQYWWIALEKAQRTGDFKSLVTQHGVGSLFQSVVINELPRIPLAAERFIFPQSHKQDLVANLAALDHFLTTNAAPWCYEDDMPWPLSAFVSDELRVIDQVSEREGRSVLVKLALPFMELPIKMNPDSLFRGDFIGGTDHPLLHLARGRVKKSESQKVNELIRSLDVSADTADLLRDWARNRVSLVGPSRRARS